MTKLSPHSVAEIRRRYIEGTTTQRQLAQEFGVSATTIWLTVKRKRHTDGPGRIYTRQSDPPDRVCRVCGTRKPISEFPLLVWRNRPGNQGDYQWRETRCRDCVHANDRHRIDSEAQRDRRRVNFEGFRLRVRAEVFAHYGGCCACCGESQDEFLSIDHINGGGKAHRESIRRRGASFYSWIIKNAFPPNLQVLCHNCNLAKGFYGHCPHERQRPAMIVPITTP